VRWAQRRRRHVMAAPVANNAPAQPAHDAWPLEFWPEPKFELEGMQYNWFAQQEHAPDLAGGGGEAHADGYFPPPRGGAPSSLGEMGVRARLAWHWF
jgi:hypothetical protein